MLAISDIVKVPIFVQIWANLVHGHVNAAHESVATFLRGQ
jgi:hypothetical protein